MLKILVMVAGAILIMGASCSVKEEVKTLQVLKTDCENLQLELDSLGAKKWTKVINEKVKQCKDHGFWERKKRQPIKTYMEGIE